MEDKKLAPGTVEINIGGCSDKGHPVPVKSLTVNGRSIPFLMDSDFILRIRGGGRRKYRPPFTPKDLLPHLGAKNSYASYR